MLVVLVGASRVHCLMIKQGSAILEQRNYFRNHVFLVFIQKQGFVFTSSAMWSRLRLACFLLWNHSGHRIAACQISVCLSVAWLQNTFVVIFSSFRFHSIFMLIIIMSILQRMFALVLMVCILTSSVQSMKCWSIGWKQSWSNFKYSSSICLEGLRKTANVRNIMAWANLLDRFQQ
jgi:hypothetical protein